LQGTSANVHVAEERGQVTEKDYDEEDRYGAVIRNGGDQAARPDNPNRYIPPSQRNATQQQAHMAAKGMLGEGKAGRKAAKVHCLLCASDGVALCHVWAANVHWL
jgi:PAB1-binding protein PBP1